MHLRVYLLTRWSGQWLFTLLPLLEACTAGRLPKAAAVPPSMTSHTRLAVNPGHPSTSHNFQSTFHNTESRNAMSSMRGNRLGFIKGAQVNTAPGRYRKPSGIGQLNAVSQVRTCNPAIPTTTKPTPKVTAQFITVTWGLKIELLHTEFVPVVQKQCGTQKGQTQMPLLSLCHLVTSQIVIICMKIILSGLLDNYNLSVISIKWQGFKGRTTHHKGLLRHSSYAGT